VSGPRRLTFVINSLTGGGAERNVVRLASAMARRGDLVTLVTLHRHIPDAYDVPTGVTRVHASPESVRDVRWFDALRSRARAAALRRDLVATTPDVIVAFLENVNLQVLRAMHGAGIPVVVSERIDPRRHATRLPMRVARATLYPSAARVHLVSAELLDWATAQVPRWRPVAIPNPVDIPKTALAPAAGQAEPTVMAMGRLSPQKGFDVLLAAFASAGRTRPAWRLVILGEGESRAALQAQAERLGIAPRVTWGGHVRDPFPMLAGADVFVLSSRYEGFPNALLEAMAMGRAVISTACPTGPREIIREGRDGFLVPVDNTGALAAALERLMDDPAARLALGQAAREVTQRFAPEVIHQQWSDLLSDVIAEGTS
jgi:GalNAc-alpha-(1->4)-GalNAc-alpha-(1->3)-diNAcBac-PP-undecaprenol alpha-1,4-N-acetyl-D-galactosaminyltransferase